MGVGCLVPMQGGPKNNWHFLKACKFQRNWYFIFIFSLVIVCSRKCHLTPRWMWRNSFQFRSGPKSLNFAACQFFSGPHTYTVEWLALILSCQTMVATSRWALWHLNTQYKTYWCTKKTTSEPNQQKIPRIKEVVKDPMGLRVSLLITCLCLPQTSDIQIITIPASDFWLTNNNNHNNFYTAPSKVTSLQHCTLSTSLFPCS